MIIASLGKLKININQTNEMVDSAAAQHNIRMVLKKDNNDIIVKVVPNNKSTHRITIAVEGD